MTLTQAPSLRVLVVDDHELTRCALKIALSKQSFIEMVAVASDGREAIAKTQQYQPHLIIMDLHMPVMDGWTASSEIKHQFPDVKIVAYSATDRTFALTCDCTAAIDAFCDKGACTKSLLETICSLV